MHFKRDWRFAVRPISPTFPALNDTSDSWLPCFPAGMVKRSMAASAADDYVRFGVWDCTVPSEVSRNMYERSALTSSDCAWSGLLLLWRRRAAR